MAGLRPRLLELVLQHRVVIVDAATGSGKSTLVPLYMAEQCAELGRVCRIVVTQPRRLAAKGLAKRVSEQTGTEVGELVGYRVGSDKRDHQAHIVYVTVGHMLEALVHNPRHLETFSHIVLDEVHERFVEADFLMALFRIVLSRPETIHMRVVVMSATLQKALGSFFRPLLLPAPGSSAPGQLSLPGRTPFEVRDIIWDDFRQEFPQLPMRKEPNFDKMRPSKALADPRRRSDELTKLCKELSEHCARLLVLMQREGYNLVLVFCPGLDQMKEMQLALEKVFAEHRMTPAQQPKVYLVHSALEEETYREALQAAPPGEWRIALSTNIAESSLTVPGVNAVVDFGLHRVNVYNDETRMSMLCTEWCSLASMKQRRGRTGRTNPGIYVRLVPKIVLDELRDFDESGVERSPLTRVTLEAAHLAELLDSPPRVLAGLPVTVEGGGAGVVSFWDGPAEGWRVNDVGGDSTVTLPESQLQPQRIQAKHILGLLPSSPKEDRVYSALAELHELGALSQENTPSVVGAACLKLPLDVTLARLVVLGWVLGNSVETVVMAAALSLVPSCDVLRTPFNTAHTLETPELNTLKHSLDTRRKADGGNLSEPLMVYRLCMEWLQNGGGGLGQQPPRVNWSRAAHPRLWPQFTEKVVDIAEALLRLAPATCPESQKLHQLVQRARGGRCSFQVPESKPEWLAAVVTWGLAPAGFVAAGQTPVLYDRYGLDKFEKVLRTSGGHIASCFSLPKMSKDSANWVCRHLACPVRWSVEEHVPGQKDKDTLIVVEGGSGAKMPEPAELLYRICSPFNGKVTVVQGLSVRPPRHPCSLKWYMPSRRGGMLDVKVNWKSEAESLLHVPRPGERGARCRPKFFLVASGGEYHGAGGRDEGKRRIVTLRGSTLLPMDDGGRRALLWLFAAGYPREAQLVALAAPDFAARLGSKDFEVRAVRLWERTFHLPPGEPVTSADLRSVNRFRASLLELGRRRPHRLAGAWQDRRTGDQWLLECLDARGPPEAEEPVGPEEVLSVFPLSAQGSGPVAELRCRRGQAEWRYFEALAGGGADAGGSSSSSSSTARGSAEEGKGGAELRWCDGNSWMRLDSRGGTALLGQMGDAAVVGFREAARALFDTTTDSSTCMDWGEPCAPRGRRWPARLVPLTTPPDAPRASRHLAPFDLGAAEALIAGFGAKLGPEWEEEDAEGADQDGSDSEDDDATFDVSQMEMNEEYMWRVAEMPEFDPANSRGLCFVESALALPSNPMCSDCGKEGKSFSKSQLSKHEEEMRCMDCVEGAKNSVYRAANADPSVGGGAAQNVPAPTCFRLEAMPGYAAVNASNVAQCSVCGVQLTKENCSASQRNKKPDKRKCESCVSASVATAK